MEVATEGPCAGHLCDNCHICQRGRCCRHDNPHYQLPELGEWDGPVHGQLGILETDGARLRCHCCGEWYVNLAVHAVRAHNLMADEYRAIFGLKRQRALFGPDLLDTHSKNSTHLRAYQNGITPEQRKYRQKWGKDRLETSLGRNVNPKIIARKITVDFHCPVCGGVRQLPRRDAKRRVVCSKTCANELLRRRQLANPIARRPDVRQKLAARYRKSIGISPRYEPEEEEK